MSETVFPPVFDRDAVLASYLETLVWTGCISYMTATAEFGGEPLANDNTLDALVSVDDLSDGIKATAKQDVEAFLDQIEAELENYPRSDELTANQLGHDFSLTRNGHGAGFWDRGLAHLGEYLTEAAKGYGSHDVQGAVVLRNPRLADPHVLAPENLDLDTLTVWES